jgi:DNA-binding NtrC family response regulator
MAKTRILVVEDDPDGRRSVTEAITDYGFEVVAVATAQEGWQSFQAAPCDVVLTDLVLPDHDGLAVLARIRQMDPEVPVLIMTAYGSVDSAVGALKAGAYDYITKPLDLDDLQLKLNRALETRRLRAEVDRLRQSVQERYGLQAIVAASPAMREVIRQVRTLADTTATVLIQGESGTGKELVARALHAEGRRTRAPFVAVNCGAMTESLLESELFGHEKGAFTGAAGRHKGAFERADGGTLFLDEVGDAPPAVQVKLLRVLEDREIVRVGGSEPFKVDVRLISASNRDLEALVESGKFREDLFYRLKVVTVQLPPLRDRRDDVRPLADRFIAAACRDHGRTIGTILPGFYEALEQYDWPGNARQLRNVIESAVIMATRNALGPDDLVLKSGRAAAGAVAPNGLTLADTMTFAEMEKQILVEMLKRHEGNRTLVADKLGISRRTIQRKVQEYGLPY